MNLVAKKPRSSEEVPMIGRVEARVRVKVLRFISCNIFMRYVSYFLSLYNHGAGVATPDPGEAPPMAGFSISQMVAWKLHSLISMYLSIVSINS